MAHRTTPKAGHGTLARWLFRKGNRVPDWQASSPFLRYFIVSAGLILALTGIAKVWSGLGNSKLLAVADPIIGIQFGHLMLAVGLAEIVIALVCFFSKRQTVALGLVAWLATNFVFYRLGLWWVDWHRPCSCLGNLTDALHVSPQTADTAMKIILGYLLIGSYGTLFWLWRQNRHNPTTTASPAVPMAET